MGRSDVQVSVGAHHAIEREPAVAVHLAVGMPANERMDWLVEKAAELGVASLQPLVTERSVLRLAGERAGRKQAHWQAIAAAACEQCGGNRVPRIHPLAELARWQPPAGMALRGALAVVRRPPPGGTCRRPPPSCCSRGPKAASRPARKPRPSTPASSR